MGDKEAAITGQVLQSLLCAEGAEAIPFVSEFLFQRGSPLRNDELTEHAALALGTSRLASALDVLIGCWNGRGNGHLSHEAILRALSASRQEQALEFLLQLIRNGRQHDAVASLEALGLHGESENIRARVRSAVAKRDSPELHLAFERAFQ